MLIPKGEKNREDPVVVAGLDIGTSKIGVVIGEMQSDGRVKILGVGTSPSMGLRQGVVINLDTAVQSIDKALEEAQLTAGIEIDEVIVGIAGDHIKSVNSRGVVGVSRSDHEITQGDVDRVIDAAKAIALPIDRKVLHVLPQEYIVDNQDGIKNPVGISGVRLEAEVHIVTSALTSAQNIVRSVERLGLTVVSIVLEPLASSLAVLDKNEKELGVALVDLGGGTTDIALFYDGAIRHTASVPLGGQDVTNDIALGLRTPMEQAEEIKIKNGCCHNSLISKNEVFTVSGIGGRGPREVSREFLATIIQPRMEEIFSLAVKEIKRSEFGEKLSAGVVLTGGGSLIEGSVQLAEEIFGLPTRVGLPQGIMGMVESTSSPIFATGIGLVLYEMQYEEDNVKGLTRRTNYPFKKVIQWIKQFFEDFF
jgi:cell division protein FtsA